MPKINPGRLLFDLGAILLLSVIIIGTLALRHAQRDEEAQVQMAASEVRRLTLQIKLQAATGSTITAQCV